MNSMKLNRQVAINIYKAQVASDGGKHITEIKYQGGIYKNYKGKDLYINRAIQLILHKRETGFSFYVTVDKELTERWGRTHYIVYFDYDFLDERRQISFHSLNDDLKKFCKNKSHYTEWDYGCSRENCHELANYLDF